MSDEWEPCEDNRGGAAAALARLVLPDLLAALTRRSEAAVVLDPARLRIITSDYLDVKAGKAVPFTVLGPVRYRGHSGSAPMSVEFERVG